jgi:hypothetical protein
MSAASPRFATGIRFAPLTTVAGLGLWVNIAAITCYGEPDAPIQGAGAQISLNNGSKFLVRETEAQITAMLRGALPPSRRVRDD